MTCHHPMAFHGGHGGSKAGTEAPSGTRQVPALILSGRQVAGQEASRPSLLPARHRRLRDSPPGGSGKWPASLAWALAALGCWQSWGCPRASLPGVESFLAHLRQGDCPAPSPFQESNVKNLPGMGDLQKRPRGAAYCSPTSVDTNAGSSVPDPCLPWTVPSSPHCQHQAP